jgi:hypothetical protein
MQFATIVILFAVCPLPSLKDGSHSIIPFSIRLFFSAVSIAAPIPIASQIALFVGLAVLLLAPHAIVSSSATSFAVSSLLSSISVSTVTPPLSCPNLINLLFSVYRLEVISPASSYLVSMVMILASVINRFVLLSLARLNRVSRIKVRLDGNAVMVSYFAYFAIHIAIITAS